MCVLVKSMDLMHLLYFAVVLYNCFVFGNFDRLQAYKRGSSLIMQQFGRRPVATGTMLLDNMFMHAASCLPKPKG